MTLTNSPLNTWQDFALIILLAYACVITSLLLLSINKAKSIYTQLPSSALGYNDNRRPSFYGKLTENEIESFEDKKHIKLTLTLTNFGKQVAFDVKAIWFDEGDNWPKWKANSELSFERPLKVGNVRENGKFDIDLECVVENVVDKKGNDVFFYFFAIELEFKQSNGETCSQVISCLNFSNEFYFEDSGNVARYFE